VIGFITKNESIPLSPDLTIHFAQRTNRLKCSRSPLQDQKKIEGWNFTTSVRGLKLKVRLQSPLGMTA
jgi:hypothetical protein